MLRFPASHMQGVPRPSAVEVAAAAATSTAATLNTCHRLFSHWTRPSLQQKQPPVQPLARRETTRGLGAVDEDRVARWWRRLWNITSHSADSLQPTHLLPRPNPMHEAQLKAMDAAAKKKAETARSTATAEAPVTTSTATPSTAAAEADSMDVDALLARLQRAIRGDGGRIPGAIVEDVWSVFDLLVPPATQDDVSAASITPDIEEKFFAFVAILNELDFDLQAVVQASKDLEMRLDAYVAQLRQLEDKEKQLAASRLTKSAFDRASEANEFTDRLMKSKSEVIRCCFQARNVGAPLYYTWLRHTASLADGLRRLMHFRKLTHYFESLCKRRVVGFNAQLKSASSKLSQAATDDLVRQQFKWRRRQMEVGLIDSALSLLFHDFFAREYLVMEELTWYSTPPSLLDQIVRAEGVHPFVGGLDEVRCRLQPTHHRHLFAFLHPAVVEEPLIAVQVALTHGIANSVDRILGRPTPLADPANATKAAGLFRQLSAAASPNTAAGETAAEAADGNVNTAIFYSINSAQSALRGMDMGNRLIKRVVREIEDNINASRQVRNLTPIHTFCTLSPIPLYVSWLAGEVAVLAAKARAATGPTASAAAPSGIFGAKLTREEEEQLYFAPLREAVAGYILRHPTALVEEAKAVATSAAPSAKGGRRINTSDEDYTAANVAVLEFLLRLFQTAPTDTPSATTADGSTAAGRWWNDHAFTGALEGPLLRSVAVYLCTAKRRGNARIRDPVGNFHVSNGATVYRLNFLANTTEQGSRESACVMINYWYNMNTVSSNVAEYEMSKHVALGEPMEALLGAEA